MPDEPSLQPSDVRLRAVGGAVVVVARGFLVRGLALLASLAIARALGPEQFAVLAIGLTAVALAGVLAEAGPITALVRRADAPTRAELQAVGFLQLCTFALVAAACLSFLTPDSDAFVPTAVLLAAYLPGLAKVPAFVRAERALDYRTTAAAEVLESAFFVLWVVGCYITGAGPLAVAVGYVVRAGVGASYLVLRTGTYPVLPRLRVRDARPLLAFGLPLQAVAIVHLTRLQLTNVATLGLAGTTGLGLWALTDRLAQLPWLVLDPLWRVSMTAMARLTAAGEDPLPDLARALRIATVGTGLLALSAAAAAPYLVPAAFGAEWETTGDTLLLALAGVYFSAPLAGIATGYLYAAGRTFVPLLAIFAFTFVWFATSLPLLPRIGAEANGWAWLAASVVDAAIFLVALHQAGASLVWRHLARTVPGIALLLIARPVAESVEVAGAFGLAVGMAAASLLVAATVDGTALRGDARVARRLLDTWRAGRRDGTANV